MIETYTVRIACTVDDPAGDFQGTSIVFELGGDFQEKRLNIIVGVNNSVAVQNANSGSA